MWKICHPPLLKFLATPLPALVVGEEKLVISFGSPHFRNASAIAVGGIKVLKVIFFLVAQKLMKPIIAKKLR